MTVNVFSAVFLSKYDLTADGSVLIQWYMCITRINNQVLKEIKSVLLDPRELRQLEELEKRRVDPGTQ